MVFASGGWRAPQDEPPWIINSDKTDHLAIQQGSALKKLRNRNR